MLHGPELQYVDWYAAYHVRLLPLPPLLCTAAWLTRLHVRKRLHVSMLPVCAGQAGRGRALLSGRPAQQGLPLKLALGVVRCANDNVHIADCQLLHAKVEGGVAYLRPASDALQWARVHKPAQHKLRLRQDAVCSESR